jgi:uncharacterized 2Fe-2S/4Fe-4S cluster protein (DUF4445 family)
MPKITVFLGEKTTVFAAPRGSIVGEQIAKHELPLEQPCAGRGTCGKCKVLNEGGLAEPDEIERRHLSDGELTVGNRLACRARVAADVKIALSPVVVYSNKIFKACDRYKRERTVPLGLAIDLGSTTVAAFLVMLDNGEVCAGGASLNQQTVYGADVISRLAAAQRSAEDAERLHRLSLASINQAVDSLQLSKSILARVQRVTIVCNPAMHHLLAGYSVKSLAAMPFQPYNIEAQPDATVLMDGIFPEGARVALPPLIGGFVGSDALACLGYFGFDRTQVPIVAIDLGTNGEVMVTNGAHILTASTAAGPAFEGVNISCGSRAVNGAITGIEVHDSQVQLETIAGDEPVGLTGSGLLSAVHQFRQAGLIDKSGRIANESSLIVMEQRGGHPSRSIKLTPDGRLRLNQWDIRELQKAKGAIRAAIEVLMTRLNLHAADLQRVILTGSFGGQVDIAAVLGIGMIPPVRTSVVETIANGAGFGAAMFLSDPGFERAKTIAGQAKQVDLDVDADFINRYISAMELNP